MRKTYKPPVCQAIIASDEDVLTASQYVEVSTQEEGNMDDPSNAVVYW